MNTDSAILLVIAELRQRLAAAEVENAQLRAALEQQGPQTQGTNQEEEARQ